MRYIKQQILHERNIGDRQVVIKGDGTVEITPKSGSVLINGDLRVTGSTPGPSNELVYHVSLEGNDDNDGLASDASRAKRTIKAAIEAAPEGATILVAPGDYYEDNPIVMKERQSVIGHSLRNTQIWPNNNTQDIFLVDNACYIFQVTFRGLRDPGWCVRIKPGTLCITSPYVQNCSNINGPWLNDGTEFVPFETVQIEGVLPGSRPIINNPNVPVEKRVNETGGGNGMLVDGDEYDQRSLVKSMVADAFTQIAQGGIGFHITNNGYTQIVSCFTVFTRTGFLATNGGYLSISNSVSDFGTFGIIADSKYDSSYTTARPIQNYYSTVGSITLVETGVGYTSAPTIEIEPPTVPGGVQATAVASFDEATGEVTGIEIINPGAGYSFVPEVTFVGGGASIDATGIANLQTNRSITVNSLRDQPQTGSIITFDGDPTEYYITGTNVTTQPFIYNETTCRRDIQRILDAVLGDSVLGTSYQSVAAGLSYLRSTSQRVILEQLAPTIYGIESARDVALEFVPDTDPTNEEIRYAIIEGFANIITILESEGATVPPITYTALPGIPVETVYAKDNIVANKNFIIEEITEYINAQFRDLVYNENKCSRDVGYIIDGLVRDINLNTNHNSIIAGLTYRKAYTSVVIDEQLPATILALRRAKELILESLSGSITAQERAEDRFNTIIDIVEYNTLPSSGNIFTNPTTAIDTVINSARQLQDNRDFLASEAIAYLDLNYPSLVYDNAEYYQDFLNIVDAVTHDLLYGGNRASLVITRQYWVNGLSTIPGNEDEVADAVNHLVDIIDEIIEGVLLTPTAGNTETQSMVGPYGTSVESTTAKDYLNIIKTAITDGLTSTPEEFNPSFEWASSGITSAVNNMINEDLTIRAAVIDYINNTLGGFTYNVAKCERDVGYIIDAALYDMMYGGTKQTRRAAEAYYNNAVIPGEEGVTEFAYKHLARVLSDVAQNIVVTPSAGSAGVYTQIISINDGSVDAANTISLLVNKIAEVIELGSIALPVEVDHDYSTLGDVTLNTKRLTVLDNKEFIEDESIRLLNLEFGGVATLNIFPGLITVQENTLANLIQVSTVSTSGHAFEYVGAGITYNALPFFGGTPIQENQFIESNGGKVFAGGVVDQIGNFKVGNFFTVNALTGSITLNAEQIDLTGLSAIGPFRRDGIPVGVALREVSNNTDLRSSLGVPDGNTVPTQVAVISYVENRYLNKLTGGTVTGDINVTGDISVNGGDITTTSSEFNLLNTNAATVNFAGAATTVNIGAESGNTYINNDLNVIGETIVSGNIVPTTTLVYDIGTPTKRFRDIYLSGGTIYLDTGQIGFNAGVFEFVGGIGTQTDIITDKEVFNLANTVATTINFGGAATLIEMGSTEGIVNINNSLVVDKDTTLGTLGSSITTINGDLEINLEDNIEGAFELKENSTSTPVSYIKIDTTNSFEAVNFGTTPKVIVQNVTESTDKDTGALIVEGGVGIEKSVNIGLNLTVTDNTILGTDRNSNTLTAAGISSFDTPDNTANVFEIKENLSSYFKIVTTDGNESVVFGSTPKLKIENITNSTTKDTGAIVVEGGIGVELNANIGVDLGVGRDIVVGGDVVVDGGDITTTASTFNLLNSVATTINFGGAATDVQIGAATGTTNVNNNLDVDGDVNIDGGDLTTSAAIFNLVNTTASTVNFAGNANSLTIGSTSGTATIRNATVVLNGDLNVNGGDLTTTQTTFNLLNTTATTVNFAGEATSVIIGASTGTTNINNVLSLDNDLHVNSSTFNIGTTNATTVNAFTSATALEIGAATGNTNINNNLTVDLDLAVNGGDISTTAAIFNLIDSGATTVNFAGAATTIDIGAATGTLTINNTGTVFNSTSHVILPVGTTAQRPSPNQGMIRYNTDLQTFEGYTTAWGSLGGVKDVDGNTYIVAESSPGANENILFFYANGSNVANLDTTSFRLLQGTTSSSTTTGALVVTGGVGISENTNIGGNLGVSGNLTVTTDVAVNGGDLTTTASTFNLVNTNATTVNFAGAATDVQIGAATGTTNINNNLDVDGDVNIDGGDLTASTTTFNLLATNVTTGNVLSVATAVNLATSAASASTFAFGPAITGNTFEINSTASGTVNLTSDVTTGIVNLYTGVTTGTVNIATSGASTVNIGGTNSTTNIDTLALVNDLAVQYGGTGASTFTENGIIYGNGTDPMQVTAAAGIADATTSFQILTVTSEVDATPVWTDTIDGGSF